MNLKTNICFVFFVIIVLSNSSIAQKYFGFNVLGAELIGGTNYSYYSERRYSELWNFSYEVPYEGRFGFNIGGGFTYRYSRIFSLHTEIVYSTKILQRFENIYYSRRIIKCWDVPLLLQLNFSSNWRLKTLIYFGPYVSFIIEDEIESSSPYAETVISSKSKDFGLLFGGGLVIPFDNYEMGIHIRYHFGFRNIGDYHRINELKADGNLSSLVLLLKIGYNFLPKAE